MWSLYSRPLHSRKRVKYNLDSYIKTKSGIFQIKVHYYSKNVKQSSELSLGKPSKGEEGETGTEIRNDRAKIKKLDTSSTKKDQVSRLRSALISKTALSSPRYGLHETTLSPA